MNKEMDYKNSLKWINSFQKFGIKLELDRIRYILNKLDNPQDRYKIIHIGGSNGKGSVSNFISSILNEAGFNVGTYTSPHLHDIRERIVVNSKKISKIDFANITSKIKTIVEKMNEENIFPTYFEIITAISFKYFKQKKVEYATVEVGLGGKYDATNVVKPCISIITNISLEHQNILGKKLSEISYQKAGIIKNSIPIFTAADGLAFRIIEREANKKKSPIFKISRNNWKRANNSIDYQEFNIKGLIDEYHVKTKLVGDYQGENISLSIISLEYLLKQGLNIKKIDILRGIEKTIHPGRMEILNKKPLIIIDGAHNSKGFKLLFDNLKNYFKYDRLFFIVGILKDKNINLMIPPMISNSDYIITTQSKNERALDFIELKKMIIKKDYGLEIIGIGEIDESIKYALTLIKENDLLCISGSLYTISEAREFLIKNRKLLTLNN